VGGEERSQRYLISIERIGKNNNNICLPDSYLKTKTTTIDAMMICLTLTIEYA